MIKKILFTLLSFICVTAFSQSDLNIYVWGGEIPQSVIRKFEKQTGIKVNFSTFESNEALYAKLKTANDFDLILPSSYLIPKLAENNKLLKLDLKKIPNLKNINPNFLNADYDTNNQYSIPYSWGVTGIFYNRQFDSKPRHWHELWHKKYNNKLLLMDDPREVFAVALISLGYSPNDPNLVHLKQAYEKLNQLKPNIKLLTSNMIQSLMIDEDVITGMAWNSDAQKAKEENKYIHMSYPSEGFSLWVDCLAILKNAPHRKAAYQFINFLIEDKNALESQTVENLSNTNQAAHKYLKIDGGKSDSIDYLIKHGVLLSALTPKANKQLLEYWQLFKMNL